MRRILILSAIFVAVGTAATVPSSEVAAAASGSPATVTASTTVVAGSASPAAAEASDADAADKSESTTWSVRPATSAGADGRSWLELELAPGESVEEHLEIQNFGDSDVQFGLQAADGYFTDTGRFNMLPASETSTDAGRWIEVADSVSVPAGGSVIVPFTVKVPRDATPGDHPAGVAAGIASTGRDARGAAVGVDSRVGFRVMTRVTGELRSAVSADVDGSYAASWNPFSPGAVEVDYTIANTGNTRLSVEPTLVVSGPFGATRLAQTAPIIEIAPGGSRSGTARLSGIWPTGIVSIDMAAVAAPIVDGTADLPAPAQAQHQLVAIPWSQLFALAVAAGLVIGLLVERRRRNRRIRALIAAARAEGRQESVSAGDVTHAPTA